MTDAPLMPKATAVWLIDNTSLSFDQIAQFCVLHPLEVKGIADGDVAAGVRGIDPISNHQLTREEIEKAEADATYKMKLMKPRHAVTEKRRTQGPKFTPTSKRQTRPDAIAWMIRRHPEVSDNQIAKLLGTTKATIQTIREGSHWNQSNLEPTDPVALGLTSQIELDAVVKKAAAKRAADAGVPEPEGATLQPAAETVVDQTAEEAASSQDYDADSVFANMGGSGVAPRDEDDAENDGR
ncbi:MAG: cell cycle transcriptional regulator TrcR [Pseudomonadota bacterium]